MPFPTDDQMSLLFQKSLEEYEKCKERTNQFLQFHQELASIMKKKDGTKPTFALTQRELPEEMKQCVWDDLQIKAKKLGLIESKE